MLTKALIEKLYLKQKLSAAQIAEKLKVGVRKVQYFMKHQKIKVRPRSEALYALYNGLTDPFKIKENLNADESFLKGLGIGLFWGEGTKRVTGTLKIANTDPALILRYREFLLKICGVSLGKIKYSLQIFGDVSKKKAVDFWTRLLDINPKALGKITITPHRGIGTYKRKNQFGVLQIYVHNTKLKKWMDSEIQKLIDLLPT